MAGRPRKNAATPEKSAAKKGRKSKALAEKLVVEEVIAETPAVEEKAAVEVPAVVAEEVKTENVSEETAVETVAEEKPAEIKPKRKYTRRAKTVEEPVVVEEPKPKRKYTKREKPVETPVEVPAENTSAPKVEAYIQGAGAERSFEELSEIAVTLSGVKSPKSISLYIKPYEHDGIAKVYYVVDKKAGHFNLFN